MVVIFVTYIYHNVLVLFVYSLELIRISIVYVSNFPK